MTERIWKITHPETGEVIYTSREPKEGEPMLATEHWREDGSQCQKGPIWLAYLTNYPENQIMISWAEEVTANPPEWWTK